MAENNPKDNEPQLNDEKLIEFVQNNLAEVKADTARMKVEHENIKKLEKIVSRAYEAIRKCMVDCEKLKQPAEDDDEDLVEAKAQLEKIIQKTVASMDAAKAKLAQKIEEYDEIYNARMNDGIALSQDEQDANEQLKQLQLEKALGDETPN